jgi:hypothetical protein
MYEKQMKNCILIYCENFFNAKHKFQIKFLVFNQINKIFTIIFLSSLIIY